MAIKYKGHLWRFVRATYLSSYLCEYRVKGGLNESQVSDGGGVDYSLPGVVPCGLVGQ